ncbi:hypothetical protein P5W99_18635 [Paraburkholderia sp. A3BS-1L]|uniref:hypothetical protein n=1 Tax=Paraburkholderia sp. A3BS-1L TaxID=3028375 RepID=UPI003DA9FB30
MPGSSAAYIAKFGRSGYLVKGNTLAELAAKLEVNAAGLVRTAGRKARFVETVLMSTMMMLRQLETEYEATSLARPDNLSEQPSPAPVFHSHRLSACRQGAACRQESLWYAYALLSDVDDISELRGRLKPLRTLRTSNAHVQLTRQLQGTDKLTARNGCAR